MNRMESTGYVIVWKVRSGYNFMDMYFGGLDGFRGPDGTYLKVVESPTLAMFYDTQEKAEHLKDLFCTGHYQDSHHPPVVIKVKEVLVREVFLENRWDTVDHEDKMRDKVDGIQGDIQP